MSCCYNTLSFEVNMNREKDEKEKAWGEGVDEGWGTIRIESKLWTRPVIEDKTLFEVFFHQILGTLWAFIISIQQCYYVVQWMSLPKEQVHDKQILQVKMSNTQDSCQTSLMLWTVNTLSHFHIHTYLLKEKTLFEVSFHQTLGKLWERFKEQSSDILQKATKRNVWNGEIHGKNIHFSDFRNPGVSKGE